jgi:hypothetical protein
MPKRCQAISLKYFEERRGIMQQWANYFDKVEAGAEVILGLESRCMVPSHPFHALVPLCAVTFTAWGEQG